MATIVVAQANEAPKNADTKDPPVSTTTEIHDNEVASVQLETGDYVNFDRDYGISGMPAHSVVMEKGEGAYLWDINGKRYIDLLSAYSSANQGHCHPKIVKAVVEQSQRLMIPGRAVHTREYTSLCKRVCDLFGLDRAAAMNSGSEAIDLAVKIARKWGYQVKGIRPGAAHILTATANYHGRTLAQLSASDNARMKEDCGPFMPSIGPSIGEHPPVRYGNIEDMEIVFDKYGSEIAAVMLESVQGSAGCVVPPQGYLRQVRELCSKHNFLLMLDEVQSGFGRTGYLTAYETENIKPDLLILGKSLVGGAYSMGMVVGIDAAMKTYKIGQHGSTFAGNPVACAAALAAIDVTLEEDLPARSRMLGSIIGKKLEQIRSPHLASYQGRGCFWSVFIAETETFTASQLASRLLSKGILTSASGNKIRIGPPLVINVEDLLLALSELENELA